MAARVELRGANGPVDQRDDYKEAKKTCDRRYIENIQQLQDVVTQEFILENKFNKDQTNNSVDLKRVLIELIQKLDGNIIFLQQPLGVLLLHHPGGDHPTAGGQHGIGTPHHGMSNSFSSVPDERIFRLQEAAIPLQTTVCVHRTPCRTHFSHAHSLSNSVVK